uniref:Uncharacterized protein n=1 Tax=Mastacembelus armatus TaxID=205130 RepID=A0A7N8YIQ5_9TELE
MALNCTHSWTLADGDAVLPVILWEPTKCTRVWFLVSVLRTWFSGLNNLCCFLKCYKGLQSDMLCCKSTTWAFHLPLSFQPPGFPNSSRHLPSLSIT